MEALGLIDTIEVASELVTIRDVVEPDPQAAAVYAGRLPIFDGLYDALAPAFRALRTPG
jgi:gluconokinase